MKLFLRMLRKFVTKSVMALPAPYRSRFMRSQIYVDEGFIASSGVVFKVAETEAELEQAFSLVQKMYESANIVNKNTTGLRITKYHILPTTKVLIAVHKGEVVGTITQIMDTAVGLPIDEFIPLQDIRSNSERICEISSLAVHPKWRSKTKGLFLPLALYAFNYAKYVTGANHLVIVTDHKARYVYEDIFQFSPLTINIQKYGMVNHDMAFAQILDLHQANEYFEKAYKNKKREQNLHTLLTAPAWRDNIFFGEEQYNIVTSKYYDFNVINSLFLKQGVLDEMKDSEKQVVHNIYSFYNNNLGQNLYINQRRFPRFYSNMKAMIFDDSTRFSTHCIEISKGGCAVIIPNDFTPQETKTYSIQVQMNENIDCTIQAQIAWVGKNKMGLKTMIYQVGDWVEHLDNIELRCRELAVAC